MSDIDKKKSIPEGEVCEEVNGDFCYYLSPLMKTVATVNKVKKWGGCNKYNRQVVISDKIYKCKKCLEVANGK